MSNPQENHQQVDGDGEYFEIRVRGHLGPSWSECFGGLKVINEQSGETRLSGLIADQAALHGILGRIRDLNLTLISVTRFDSQQRAGDGQDGEAR